MNRTNILCTALLLAPLTIAAGTYLQSATAAPGQWNATGTLLESCTCAVPCTCNFGEGPSPHHYCHAVFAYKLDKASWNGVDLTGLVVGGADGPNGSSGYLDPRATPAQRPALEAIGRAIFAQGGPAGGPRRFAVAPITHEVKGNYLRLTLGNAGGFTANLIMGRDGKTPVVVENNTTWPIFRSYKGKAALSYRDAATGKVTGDGTNANYGTFTFTGRTSDYAHLMPRQTTSAAPVVKATHTKACCAAKG